VRSSVPLNQFIELSFILPIRYSAHKVVIAEQSKTLKQRRNCTCSKEGDDPGGNQCGKRVKLQRVDTGKDNFQASSLIIQESLGIIIKYFLPLRCSPGTSIQKIGGDVCI
jgi:hypothetical protein